MPSFTATIEDFSPAIIYSPDFKQGDSQSDKLASSYSASSFFASNSNGGTAQFTFNGTGIELFGSKRSNHGLYAVKIDGTTFPSASGQATDPGVFQTSLFSKTDLPQGLHTVTLINQGTSGQFVDLDYITWHGNVGQSNEKLSVTTVQDDDPSFVYSPSNAWTDSPDNVGFFSGLSGHATTTPGASLTYTFQGKFQPFLSQVTRIFRIGDGISLFGPVGPNYSPFSVQLNGASLSFTAQKARNVSQVLLYHADNLGPGSHSVKLLFQPSATGQTFAIDYAEVYTISSTANKSSSSSSGLTGGAIAGLVIGLLALCGMLLIGLWLFLRRRRDRHLHRSDGPAVLESEVGSSNSFNSFGHVVAPTSYPDVSGPVMYEYASESRLVGVQAPAATFMDFNSTHTSNADDRSECSSRYAGSTRTVTRSITNSTSPRRNLSRSSSSSHSENTKGATITLPTSAGESLSYVPADQLQATRMVVNGRPQDFGSLSTEGASGSGEVSQSYAEHHPPPDYVQATEVYR